MKRHSYKNAARHLINIYKELDSQINLFKKKTKLSCPKGCGVCCNSSKIETTSLELIPLAIKLWKDKTADYWLEKVNSSQLNGPCVFYEKSAVRQNGCCSVYKLRPLICRLFGFSAKKDKYGRPMFVTCSIIKKTFPQEYKNAISMPLMPEFMMKLLHIDPEVLRRQLPINAAIKEALEKAGYINLF